MRFPYDGIFISGELRSELHHLIHKEQDRQRKRLREEGREEDSHNNFHVGQAMDGHAPRWMNLFRRDDRDEGRTENVPGAGRIQAGELEVYAELRRRIMTVHHEKALTALQNLLKWSPECVPDVDEIVALQRELDDWAEMRKEGAVKGGLPFVSESYLYAVMGKEDARTFLGLVREVVEAMGYGSLHDVQAGSAG